MNLHRYLGLKHKFAADPKDGEAADCLLLCFTLLDEAGIYRPKLDSTWMEMAKNGLWQSLETVWKSNTVPISKPEPYAVTLHWNKARPGHPRLGVSTVIENSETLGIVMIHARKGVVWLPLSTPGLPEFNFCKFR